MTSKSNKERRKELLAELRMKQVEEFVNSLPMKKEYFMSLFDYLDNRLEDCDHHMTLTMAFLNENGIENVDEVLAWLREKGGYCDCEVLNVEEQFEFLK